MISNSLFSRSLRGFNAFSTDNIFKSIAADTIYNLCDKISEKYENKNETLDVDVADDYLKVNMKGKEYLISRQTPTRQIWVSSPQSGSLKYDYDNKTKKWYDHKNDKIELEKYLLEEMKTVYE